MSGRRLGQFALALLIGLSLAASNAFGPSDAAAAAPGTWGANAYHYLDGTICPTPAGSSPLASWDFSTGAPGYLIEPVISSGSTDSATLPFSSAGTQTISAITPGRDGFASAADISTYAALLSEKLTTDEVAEVANAVMTKAGGRGVPSCVDTTDVAALVNAASELAGPYTISLVPASNPTVIGQADTLTATVRSATGRLVPGAALSFTSTNADLSATSKATDGAGTASIQFTTPADSPAAQVSITASVSVSTGLNEVSIQADPNPVVPSGASDPAIYPAPPVTATATATVPIDPTAQPVIRAQASVNAVGIGFAFSPIAVVSGLRGHTSEVNFTIYGPQSNAIDCAHQNFSVSSPVAATTGSVQTSGDATVTALPWKPSKAGCYFIRADITTTNASPNVSATSGFDPGPANVLVLATTASLSLSHPIASVGPLTADIKIDHSDSSSGTIAGRVLGPLSPSAGSCARLNWTNAPHAVSVPTIPINGDAPVTLRSTAVTGVGCYQIQATLDLAVSGFGTVEVPVTTSTPAILLVIAPSVIETSDQIWSISPASVATQVTSSGTMGQPAHVEIEMMYVPTSVFGCRTVDWSDAVLETTGPTVAIPAGDATISVPSGRTPKLGCYAPVPRLIMDANPAVTAAGPLGVANDAIGAGVDANAKIVRPHDPGLTASDSGIYRAGELFAVLLGAAIAATITLARYDTA